MSVCASKGVDGWTRVDVRDLVRGGGHEKGVEKPNARRRGVKSYHIWRRWILSTQKRGMVSGNSVKVKADPFAGGERGEGSDGPPPHIHKQK